MFEELGLTEVRRIGSGGSSNVYAAVDPELGPVAVKVIQRVGPNPVRRFQREVEALAVLDDLPGVLRVLGTGRTSAGDPFLMVPLMARSLQDVISDWGPMGWIQAADTVAVAAETVHQAHLRGVVHADLKPENLLVDDAQNLYVSDFGIAKLAAPSGPTVTTPGWTPAYAAPEVAGGQRATALSDVYGLGATLAALLTGTPPAADDVDGQAFRTMVDSVATLVPSEQGVRGAEIAQIVQTAMAADPAQRYQSAQHLAIVLRETLGEVGGQSKATIVRRQPGPVPLPHHAHGETTEPSPVRRRRWPFALAGLAVLAGLIGALVALDLVPERIRTSTEEPDPAGIGSAVVDPDPSGSDQSDEQAQDGAPDGSVCAVTVDVGTDLLEVVAGLAPGSSVCLDPGMHQLSAPLELTADLKLRGAAADSTVLVAPDGGDAVIRATGVNLELSSVTITGPGAGPDEGALIDGVVVESSKLVITDIVISGMSGSGLLVFGTSTGSVTGSSFVDNGATGLELSDSSQLEIGTASATANGLSGFSWIGASGGMAIDSVAENNGGAGFSIGEEAGPELVSNAADGNGESGFFWSGAAGGEATANRASENMFSGFAVGGAATPTLRVNTATGNLDSGFAFGEDSAPSADNNTADGSRSGFVIWGSARPTLQDNQSRRNAEYGYVWYDETSGTVARNDASGNTSFGYGVLGSATPELIDNRESENGDGAIQVGPDAEPTLTDNRFDT